MPLRVAIILFGLFAACVAIAALAWAYGGQFYLFAPSRWGLHRPPTHPVVILMYLGLSLGIFFFLSQHYGLVMFTGLPVTLLLGTTVGYLVFAWTPTLVQWLLTFVAGAEAYYGWAMTNEYFDY